MLSLAALSLSLAPPAGRNARGRVTVVCEVARCPLLNAQRCSIAMPPNAVDLGAKEESEREGWTACIDMHNSHGSIGCQ